MTDAPLPDLYADPHVVQFYDLASRARPDFAFCKELAKSARSILDLGCGTGELATDLASNHDVTGVEPATAMLDIAKNRAGGEKINWIEADARNLKLDQRFDLIILTGHTFQVFLSDFDQNAVLATIERHLKPEGRFIFDSRNPNYTQPKTRERSDTTRHLSHPQLGEIEAYNKSSYDEPSGILTYENGYKVKKTGITHVGTAKIRYTPIEALAIKLSAAGLTADNWLGDWEGKPFTPTAREIIPLGRLT